MLRHTATWSSVQCLQLGLCGDLQVGDHYLRSSSWHIGSFYKDLITLMVKAQQGLRELLLNTIQRHSLSICNNLGQESQDSHDQYFTSASDQIGKQ